MTMHTMTRNNVFKLISDGVLTIGTCVSTPYFTGTVMGFKYEKESCVVISLSVTHAMISKPLTNPVVESFKKPGTNKCQFLLNFSALGDAALLLIDFPDEITISVPPHLTHHLSQFSKLHWIASAELKRGKSIPILFQHVVSEIGELTDEFLAESELTGKKHDSSVEEEALDVAIAAIGLYFAVMERNGVDQSTAISTLEKTIEKKSNKWLNSLGADACML